MRRTEGLARLQADFAAALEGGDAGEFVAHLAGEPATVLARLAVYRRAIAANRHRALLAAYPVVARSVGDAFFAEAALQYSRAVPPGDADLNRHGAAFADFLADYPHAAALPWLPDVARLEWASHEALLAADAPPCDFAGLAAVPEEDQEQLAFTLHPSVRLERSAWPVLAIWEANQPDRDGTPDRDTGADDVLVWREDNRVRMALLAQDQAAIVAGLAIGRPLGELADPGLGEEFAALLAWLAGHGMLAGFAVMPGRLDAG
jgi:hypothetical protein